MRKRWKIMKNLRTAMMVSIRRLQWAKDRGRKLEWVNVCALDVKPVSKCEMLESLKRAPEAIPLNIRTEHIADLD